MGTMTVNVYDQSNALTATQSLPVTVTVWNFYLPDNHYCATAMGMLSSTPRYSSCAGFLAYSGVEFNSDGTVQAASLPLAQKVLKAYYDLMLDNGVSAYNLPYTPIDSGTDFGYVKDAKAALLYMADPRVTSFLMTNAGLGSENIAAAEAVAFADIVSRNKILQDKSYYYIGAELKKDEIDISGPVYHNFIKLLNRWWTGDTNTNNAWPAINVLSPVNGDVAYNVDNFQRGFTNPLVISIWNFYNGADNAAAFAAVKEWEDAGRRVWIYPDDAAYGGYFFMNRKNSYNFNIGMSMGVARHAMFWSTYNFGMSGVMYWMASGWMHNPWSDYIISPTGVAEQPNWDNGNGVLVYPPKPGMDPAAPIASLRLKQINAGLYDYDYLTLARQFIDGGSANGPFVSGLLTELGMTPDSSMGFTRSIDTMNDVRMKIGNALSAEFSSGADYNWGPWQRIVDPDATHQGMDVRVDSNGAQQGRAATGGGALAQVTFDTVGGSAVEPATVTVAIGSKIPAPADPTLVGSEFQGWFLNGMKIDLSSYIVTGVTNLTARWGPDMSLVKTSDRVSAAPASSDIYEYEDEDATSFSMAIDAHNQLYTWGNNTYGQLGDGTTAAKTTPAPVAGVNDAAISACGNNIAAVIRTDGTLWVWGMGSAALCGDSSGTDYTTPHYLTDNVKQVSLSDSNGAYVKTDGSLWVWGGGWWGTLGNGYDNQITGTPAPIRLYTMGYDVKKIAVGLMYMTALKQDGSVWSWGWGARGNIGNGANNAYNMFPTSIIPGGVTDIACGSASTYAVKSDGSLWAWGLNNAGQLGDGTTESKNVPVKIGDGFKEIAAGQKHAAAVKTDGSLQIWGLNNHGQLGFGAINYDQHTPHKLWDSAAGTDCGWLYTLAVKTDGSLWAWGDNRSSQLGDGTETMRTAPVQVMPPGSIIAYTPETVKFSALTANGAANITTTDTLTLTFSQAITGLSAADLTVTGATKGALSGAGPSYTLAVSGIAAEGASVTVAVANPAGYSITPSSLSTTVHKEINDVPMFTDAEGNKLVHLTANTLVTTVSQLNKTGTTEKLTLLVAVYTPDRKLVHIGTDTKTINAGQTADFQVRIDLPENVAGLFVSEGYYVNVFIWEWSTYVPVTAKITFM
jgi:alpha-tubulin suppressor-like RCC1 family protein